MLPIIGVTMAVIMVVTIMVEIITLSLIMGTGIKLIITAETHPIQWPITGLMVVMAPDRQIARQQEHLIVPLPGHPIVRQPAALRRQHAHQQAGLQGQLVHPRHSPTGRQAGSIRRHVRQHQIILQGGAPGVAVAIAEEEALVADREVVVEEVAGDK